MGEVVDPAELAKRFTPPYGGGRTVGEPPIPHRKPLIDLPDDASRGWQWTDHALERLEQRGIGVFEVLSAIYAPDWSQVGSSSAGKRPDGTRYGVGKTRVIRGDIEVVYDPVKREIVSVVDRLGERRTKKREPLSPIATRHVEPVDMHPRTPLGLPAKPEPVAVAQDSDEQSLVDTAARKETPVALKIPSGATAREATRVWIETKKPGEEFYLFDAIGDLQTFGHTRAGVDQALRRLIADGEVERRARGIYARPKHPKKTVAVPAQREPEPEPVKPEPEPAKVARFDVATATMHVGNALPPPPLPKKEEVAVSNGHKAVPSGRLELTSTWAEPPAMTRDQDGLQAHISSKLDELADHRGQWMMVVRYPAARGSAASGRTKSLRSHFPDLEFTQRGGAIYCRYPEE